MKKIIFMMAFACLHAVGHSQSQVALPDGLYLVAKVITDSTAAEGAEKGKALVRFNALFLDNAPEGATGLLIHTGDFVPLDLDEAPELIPETDAKKMVQLSFSRLAAGKLKTFSAENRMKQVTIVLDGEALTLHKIKEPITGGKMQITRCDDNACEHIYVRLKDKVKK